jgi:hypothetical protein
MSDFKGEPRMKKIPMLLTLSPELIIAAINEARENDDIPPLPKDARVKIKLPSGGDLSGDILELRSDLPLLIEWEENV